MSISGGNTAILLTVETETFLLTLILSLGCIRLSREINQEWDRAATLAFKASGEDT